MRNLILKFINWFVKPFDVRLVHNDYMVVPEEGTITIATDIPLDKELRLKIANVIEEHRKNNVVSFEKYKRFTIDVQTVIVYI